MSSAPSANDGSRLCTVIKAPARAELPPGQRTIFLAGNTSGPSAHWRDKVITAVSHLPVVLLDPTRPDWDKTWRESLDFPLYVEQVNWELGMHQKADIVVVHLSADTLAPVSLMELGLRVGSGKRCIVACEEGYAKRGNVQLVCEFHGVEMCGNVDELAKALVDGLEKDIGEQQQEQQATARDRR